MVSAFSTHKGRRLEAGAICCVGTWTVDGAPPRRGGRFGHRHHTSIAPLSRVGEGAALRLSYVGHASVLIQTAGQNILLDPVWSKRASPFHFAGPKRVNDPRIAFADLPPIDVVLVSHGHYDHLDLATLSRLAAVHRPRVVTPLGNDTIIRNHDPAVAAEAYDWEDQIKIGEGVAVTLVATRHWSARNLSDRNMSLWASFVIEAPGGRVIS